MDANYSGDKEHGAGMDSLYLTAHEAPCTDINDNDSSETRKRRKIVDDGYGLVKILRSYPSILITDS
jgi:hypothetical protein